MFMRFCGSAILVSIIILVTGCSKSASGPTSAEGKWTYTTPDGKMKVDFELIKTASGSLDIQNQAMKVDGTSYNSEKQLAGVSLPTIASIRINVNDAKAVYPYYIQFLNGKVSSDFNRIEVPDGEYSFPWGTTVKLKSVSVTRP